MRRFALIAGVVLLWGALIPSVVRGLDSFEPNDDPADGLSPAVVDRQIVHHGRGAGPDRYHGAQAIAVDTSAVYVFGETDGILADQSSQTGLGLFLRIAEGDVFVVILWYDKDCVDFGVLGIGFVLQKKGRFVEGALHL